MDNGQKLLVLIYFLLVALPSQAHAYTNFTANSDMASSINGYVAYNPSAVMSYAYNTTCNSATGCMIIDNNGSASYVELWAEDNETTFANYTDINDFVNSSEYAQTVLTLPANKEGLVFFRYRFNATLGTTASPKLYVYNQTLLYEHALNTTANVWHNFSVVIPPSDVERDNIRVYVGFYMAATPTKFNIDKLHFLTLDETEDRSADWSGNWTIEAMRYCGVSVAADAGLDANTNTSSAVYYATVNNNVEHLDKLWGCLILKLNNTLVTRRTLGSSESGSSDGSAANWVRSVDHNFYVFYQDISGDTIYTNAYAAIVEMVGLSTFKFTTIWRDTGMTGFCNLTKSWPSGSSGITSSHTGCISFNGTPITLFNWTGLIIDNPNAFRQTLSLDGYLNTSSPAGQAWKIRNYGTGGGTNYAETTYEPFFTGEGALCDEERVCNPFTNNVTFQDVTCNQTIIAYCGSWGCNPSYTDCDYGFIGSYCYSNYSIKTVSVNGTITYTSCIWPELCFNTTGTTAECFTPEEFITWNETNTTSGYNAYSTVSYWFFSDFGVSESVANSALSLVFALVCAAVFGYISRKSEHVAEVALVAFAASCTICALLGVLSAIVWVVLVILDIFMLYSIYQKARGSKGGG